MISDLRLVFFMSSVWVLSVYIGQFNRKTKR
jgi:hypothetical protein